MIFLTGLGVLFLFFFLGVALIGAPYVPSLKKDLDVALNQLYPISSADFIIDIGSGDGVVLRQAAKRGARGLGYEINPFLFALAWWLSRNNSNISFKLTNFWQEPFPKETTVVYTFGESRDILKMTLKVQAEATRLNKPLHFISYGVKVPGLKSAAQQGAHHLYLLEPLQV